MIHSMTAFARAELSVDPFFVRAVIRSYNSRHLDIALKLGLDYVELEEKIKARIARRISRGRVEVNLRIKDTSDEAPVFTVNSARAEAYYNALINLKKRFKIDRPVTLELLTGFGDIMEPEPRQVDTGASWEVVSLCVDSALDQLVEMRRREGDHIAQDLARRLDRIEAGLAKIEAASQGLLSAYHNRLMERISRLTEGKVELDSVRVAQEAAFLADRSDISEELVRAASHIVQFRQTMESGKPGGRKLNFLIQEFNREFNTMGSKTEKAEISHQVVELRTELEKIREQIQNVE